MVEWQLPAELVAWILALSQPLHGRLAWRLLPLLRGVLFARGRRTVASWLRAAGLGADFRPYYYFLGSLGPRAGMVAALLLRLAVRVLGTGDRLVFGLDDTPTKRAGPHVEGAGIHHNPTPGPARQKFLYGHIWVTIAWLAHHPRWGTIGLPLRALLYVRQKDVGRLTTLYGVNFRTKLEMAGELVTWAADWLRLLGKVLWVVTDGAYAKRPFLRAARAAGVVVVSRLRKDAALWSLPVPPRPGAPKRRGRPPTYGKEAISLANVAAFHLNLWAHTLVELWAWRRSAGRLCDRQDSPWDDPGRRPSHADRCNALKREGLREVIRGAGRRRPLTRKIRTLLRGMLKLIA